MRFSLPGWTLLQTRILPAAFIFIIQMISWPSYKHGKWVLYVDAQDRLSLGLRHRPQLAGVVRKFTVLNLGGLFHCESCSKSGR
ncbi:hypothetical protein BO79DRAFT_65596 [Aspergillus costaricaensis CBS 115574]|uniref:Uncharacterized protein n=1 Tax=Aspergillus costaricaensis CBS 115574 TaxID=1448317 RepID=A0ACD1I106_9EURO|nr:hypothetical protein BO79DRAFT_65596 [Aspergillus costaricaensis CBS 115574]RAK83733.1 hypothetical protein BO79DRAFT_65596 [Aspergillus costaricaensis CBS 115574]